MNKTIFASVAGLLAAGFIAYLSFAQVQDSSTQGGPGEPMVEVVVPELSNSAQRGQVAYEAHCASCHGENAAGSEGFGPPLVHLTYESAKHGNVSFLYAVKTGVKAHHWQFGDMPPINGVTEEDIALMVIYIRALQAANGVM